MSFDENAARPEDAAGAPRKAVPRPRGARRGGKHAAESSERLRRPPDSAAAGETKPPARPRKKGLSPIVRFLIKLGAVALILFVVFGFVLGIHINHGNRMYPFIMDGDLLITYKLDPCRMGEAVLYRSPATGEKAISRIVAIDENEIEITELGELLVNGYSPAETVFYQTKELEGSTIVFPYTMGEGEVFLLDDYRTIGVDSRAFGPVREDELLGKVVYVFRRRGI